jgi:hypothetical protein
MDRAIILASNTFFNSSRPMVKIKTVYCGSAQPMEEAVMKGQPGSSLIAYSFEQD